MSLVFFSVFILTAAIVYLYVVPPLENRLIDEKEDRLKNYAILFSGSFVDAFNQGASPVYLDLLTQQYAERADARILMINGQGQLLADSLKGQAFDQADYPVANTAMVEGRSITDVARVGDSNYGMAAVPLVSNGRIFGAMVVSSSMADVESAVSEVRTQLISAAVAALIIALASIYMASHILARRIQRIEKGAVRIAQGDFDIRVPVTSRDELGQLAQAFNDMSDRLGSAFQQIDVEKRRAKLMLDDLSEGVIGIDTQGSIIVANPAAEKLLGREITPPQPLAGCVPEEVFDLWDSMSETNPAREDTFILDGEKALQVHTSFLSDQEELKSLLVMRDVSQEVKLDRSRRDFIANASHELKTPLFSLGGFLEILKDEDVDEQTKKEFIATMKQQVDRLAELARNLLDLSRMDSGGMEISITGVQLREVVDSVAREFSLPAPDRDSRVDASALPVDLTALCDRDRMTQLVRILLDNALKYSPERAGVEVAGGRDGEKVVLTVADSGPGIPDEELSRIFERFYRGRGAGRVRGTGLGLSIASELVRLMEGDIEVESSANGTIFSVTLPGNGERAGAGDEKVEEAAAG